MGRRRRTTLLGFALAGIGLLAAGCGGSEDFANDPRPPAPIEMSAKVSDDQVLLSPTQSGGKPVGAGLATVTIANLTDEPTHLTFAGPEDRTTDPIVANGTLDFKIDLRPGNYTVSADNVTARPMEFAVGPERPSAQNDLLLP